jgi:glyoxylase-like metal-dependent hydrolase (beta-lactamase superfamily II)
MPSGRGENRAMPTDPLAGLTVLERGWLSSNNILIHPTPDEHGALLVDAGHVNHSDQTVALVGHALAGVPLAGLVNTHLHSDHCGGNAALQSTFGMPITVPPGAAAAVAEWDAHRLSHAATGQRSARFHHHAVLAIGGQVHAGGRDWQVLAAPGHDPDSVMLFDAEHGVLISADALWEHGFGVVFPELVGEPGFEDVAAVLDAIERLPVRRVIPGHGRPFDDVAGALGRARSRLDAMQRDPARHARHAVKVLIKYHMMEEQRQARAELVAWAAGTPLLAQAWSRHGPSGVAARDWCAQLVQELLDQGALGWDDGQVVDR